MLKKTITYTNFDGIEVTEDLYFNLTTTEILEMELEISGGMKKMLEDLVSTKDEKRIASVLKDVVLRSYGEKSEDGRRFIKSKQKSEEFEQTAAFSDLFVELLTDPDLATAFINGIIPQKLSKV